MPADVPVLTPTAKAHLESLVDLQNPLSCGGYGVRNPEVRAAYFDGVRRSIFAMYWLSQGKPWPDGMLRCDCPHGHRHCVSHRREDAESYSRSRRRTGEKRTAARPQKAPPLVTAAPVAAEIAQPEREAPVAPPSPVPATPAQQPAPSDADVQPVVQPSAGPSDIYSHEQALLRGVTFTTGALRPSPAPPAQAAPPAAPPAADVTPPDTASTQRQDQPEGASPFPERERDDPAELARRWVAPRREGRRGRGGGPGRGRMLKAAAAAAVVWTLWFVGSQVVDAAWPDWELQLPGSLPELVELFTKDDGTSTTTSVLPQTPPAAPTETAPSVPAPPTPSSLVFCVPADEAAGRCTR